MQKRKGLNRERGKKGGEGMRTCRVWAKEKVTLRQQEKNFGDSAESVPRKALRQDMWKNERVLGDLRRVWGETGHCGTKKWERGGEATQVQGV